MVSPLPRVRLVPVVAQTARAGLTLGLSHGYAAQWHGHASWQPQQQPGACPHLRICCTAIVGQGATQSNEVKDALRAGCYYNNLRILFPVHVRGRREPVSGVRVHHTVCAAR